jgi:leucyl aminopeptidase
MPFHFAYAETLESKIADYINCYEKRDAQSTVAAEFLKLFAHDTNFVHADIAGTSEYLHHYVPVLVRTLFHFTKNFKS